MHTKIFRGNSKQIEIQHITSKLSEEKKMARELPDDHEPSQLAQLVKAHHRKDFCRFYLCIEQLVLQREHFVLWLETLDFNFR